MPKINIDGLEIEVEKGTTVIQAAEMLGIEIPRYCYHPGLSIVGVCRICLVEIERIPKLQVACYTPVTDGMVVHTNNEKVREARSAVLEFLLVNHPLDCPVCDQAGECWLQNYYMQHGLYDSQMYENKVKKHKAVAVGPNVMLDSERCILCSRCVRFCDEISKTHELGIFNRGDHAELLPYPDCELDNKYAGNTIDICPVGALTDRDFRFRTRVWYLNETKSICPGCSTGCNIYVHHNDRRPYKADGMRIARLKPRFHPDVNQWWMCDEGRYGFTFVDDKSRLLYPLKKTQDRRDRITWPAALEDLHQRMQEIIDKHGPEAFGVILSSRMTNENLYAACRFFIKNLQVRNIAYAITPREKGYSDDFLIKADKSPNTAGADDIIQAFLNANLLTVSKLLNLTQSKKLKALVICHQDLKQGFAPKRIKNTLRRTELVVYLGSNDHSTAALADFILPAAAFVEEDGSFTNFQRRVQRIYKAVEPPGEVKPDWKIFRDLSKKFGKSLPFFEAEDVFRALAEELPAFKGLTYQKLGDEGVLLNHLEEKTEPELEAKVA
ncbi:MAG: molybdopterin-dependent oxidoreductase [bacterium]